MSDVRHEMKSVVRRADAGEPLERWHAAWSAGVEQTNELLWLLRVLRLRWKMIVIITVLLTTSAALILRQITPLYSATADVLIDVQQMHYADLSAGPNAAQGTVWPAELETYVKIIWSDELANEVVRSIGPAAFKAPPSPADRIRDWLRPVSAAVRSLLGWPPQGDSTAASTTAETGHARAVRIFQQYLRVERDSLAAALYVTYRAPDPEFAAKVANATAEAFPKELLRSWKAALAATANYLGERVQVLGDELKAADTEMRALQNQMSTFDGESVAELRYRELIRAVSEAEAQVAVAYADVVRAEAEGIQGLDDAATSETLAELRRDELTLERKLAEAASTLGEQHPTMLAMRAEQGNIRASIRTEVARIQEQIRKALKKSEARAAALRQELDEVEKKLTADMDDQVRLKQLMTRTESTRQIYQDILARYQRASEQQLMLTPRARLINVAQPASKPDRRKLNLLLAMATCASVAVGASLALLLELRRRGFRSSEELAHETGLAVLGALPHVGRQRRPVYVEAVRRLGLHVCPISESEGARVILVSSPLPCEGKTVVSLSLARELADTGQRVLLIDADLRKRGLQHLVNLTVFPIAGLTDLLTSSEAKLDSAIVRDTRSGADLLLALDPVEDPGQLLASSRMAEVLGAARQRYDVIIIDTPPVLAVSEAMSLATLADRLLVVVRSEATPRKAVLVALKELRAISDRPLGLVLNGIRLGRSYARYGDADHLAYYRASARYLKS